MKIGIKYCGGCNPRYERRKFLNKLKNDLGNKCSFELARENISYDMLLVLAGCGNCCADYSNLTYQNEALCVRDITDYDKTLHSIRETLHKNH